MKIQLFPLEKAVIDGVSVALGMARAAVEAAIGPGRQIRKRTCYFNNALAVDYGPGGTVEFIECLGGALRPEIDGVSAFDAPAGELSALLQHKNGAPPVDTEQGCCLLFQNISAGLYREAETAHWDTIGIGIAGYYQEPVFTGSKGGRIMNICMYGASSNTVDGAYLEAARRFGLELARRGHGLVFGGGATGLMGAAARGVTEGGGYLLGVAPTFFQKPGVLYERCTEFLYTDTMRERKQLMEDRSDAFVMAPGGIGTFEEFFEILTLRQLGRHRKPIAVLNTRGYYDPLLAMLRTAAGAGFLYAGNLALFTVHAEPEALLDALA